MPVFKIPFDWYDPYQIQILRDEKARHPDYGFVYDDGFVNSSGQISGLQIPLGPYYFCNRYISGVFNNLIYRLEVNPGDNRPVNWVSGTLENKNNYYVKKGIFDLDKWTPPLPPPPRPTPAPPPGGYFSSPVRGPNGRFFVPWQHGILELVGTQWKPVQGIPDMDFFFGYLDSNTNTFYVSSADGIWKIEPGTTDFVKCQETDTWGFNNFVVFNGVAYVAGRITEPYWPADSGVWYLDNGTWVPTNYLGPGTTVQIDTLKIIDNELYAVCRYDGGDFKYVLKSGNNPITDPWISILDSSNSPIPSNLIIQANGFNKAVNGNLCVCLDGNIGALKLNPNGSWTRCNFEYSDGVAIPDDGIAPWNWEMGNDWPTPPSWWSQGDDWPWQLPNLNSLMAPIFWTQGDPWPRGAPSWWQQGDDWPWPFSDGYSLWPRQTPGWTAGMEWFLTTPPRWEPGDEWPTMPIGWTQGDAWPWINSNPYRWPEFPPPTWRQGDAWPLSQPAGWTQGDPWPDSSVVDLPAPSGWSQGDDWPWPNLPVGWTQGDDWPINHPSQPTNWNQGDPWPYPGKPRMVTPGDVIGWQQGDPWPWPNAPQNWTVGDEWPISKPNAWNPGDDWPWPAQPTNWTQGDPWTYRKLTDLWTAGDPWPWPAQPAGWTKGDDWPWPGPQMCIYNFNGESYMIGNHGPAKMVNGVWRFWKASTDHSTRWPGGDLFFEYNGILYLTGQLNSFICRLYQGRWQYLNVPNGWANITYIEWDTHGRLYGTGLWIINLIPNILPGTGWRDI